MSWWVRAVRDVLWPRGFAALPSREAGLQHLQTTMDLPAGHIVITAPARNGTGAKQARVAPSLGNHAGHDNTSWPRIWIDVG